tara:strand:+ start:616 stop:879 length:264 start_codon:yes stop_codon:yes gene_type:complete
MKNYKKLKQNLAKQIIEEAGGAWKDSHHIGSGQVSYEYLEDLLSAIGKSSKKQTSIIKELKVAQEMGIGLTIKKNADGSIEYSTKTT